MWPNVTILDSVSAMKILDIHPEQTPDFFGAQKVMAARTPLCEVSGCKELWLQPSSEIVWKHLRNLAQCCLQAEFRVTDAVRHANSWQWCLKQLVSKTVRKEGQRMNTLEDQ